MKACGVRFDRNARAETHEVEHLGDFAAEFLRIELKTTAGPPHRDARLREDADSPWEDSQVRISRIHGTPPAPARPTVLISEGGFTWFDPREGPAPMPPEPSRWTVLVELKGGRVTDDRPDPLRSLVFHK